MLIEQRDFLGGTPVAENYCRPDPAGRACAAPDPADDRAGHCSTSLAEVRLGTELAGRSGGAGRVHHYAAATRTGRVTSGADQTIECGAIIIATGFGHFDPGRSTQMYGYYEFPDVITQPDLEAMLSEDRVLRPSNGQPPERVCFVQCVGSRDRQIGNEYCSKVCCGVASKEAIEIRELLPDSKVLIFYIDMRMYGYWENEIYWPAQEQHHVQYVKGLITEVLPKGDRLLVRGEDTTMGRPMEAPDGPRRAVGRHGAVAGHSRVWRGCSGSSRTSTGSSRPSGRRSTQSAPTGKGSSPVARPSARPTSRTPFPRLPVRP